MLGIVVVSHSRPLAEAAVNLATQMVTKTPPPLAIAAGVADGDTVQLGTDAMAIFNAIEMVAQEQSQLATDGDQSDTEDGILIFVDLGSAILSTEMAIEFCSPELAQRCRISAAPLVEGLIPALLGASSGKDLAAVAAEAESALRAKQKQLGIETSTTAIEETKNIPVETKKTESITAETRPAGNTAVNIHNSNQLDTQTAASETKAENAITSIKTGGQQPEYPTSHSGSQATAGGSPTSGFRRRFLVSDPQGLHARPAAALAGLVSDWEGEVWLQSDQPGAELIDAGSMLDVAASGITSQEVIIIELTEPENTSTATASTVASAAAAWFTTLISSNCGLEPLE